MILSLYQPHFSNFAVIQIGVDGTWVSLWCGVAFIYTHQYTDYSPIQYATVHLLETHYSMWRFILMIGGERKWNHRVSFTVIGLRRKWGIKLSRIVTDWTWLKIWKQKIELITLWLNICGQVFRYVYCFVCLFVAHVFISAAYETTRKNCNCSKLLYDIYFHHRRSLSTLW